MKIEDCKVGNRVKYISDSTRYQGKLGKITKVTDEFIYVTLDDDTSDGVTSCVWYPWRVNLFNDKMQKLKEKMLGLYQSIQKSNGGKKYGKKSSKEKNNRHCNSKCR